jgi:uncharacterized phage protein gp47/JayE
MAFSIPKLSRLITRAKSDIEATLQNGGVYVRRSFETAMAKASAGLAHTLHQHLRFISEQIIIDTADDEYLVRWADIFFGPDSRLPAEQASFDITVTGDTANVPIPDGTRWNRADGVSFEAVGDYALPAAAPFQVTVTVQAVEAGVASNTVPGDTLTIESPIAGVDADATVDGAGSDPIGGGADIETIDALRARLLLRLQTPPKGGAVGDYIAWALASSSGVTRAWELPLIMGPGSVTVLFVQDTFDADGFFIDTIFPGPAEVQAVEDYIAARCPVTVTPDATPPTLVVQAPTEQTLDPSIQLEPNTTEVQQAVTRQLEDLLLREAAPGGTLEVSKINEAISLATGEEDHVLVSPAADVTSTNSQLLTLGTPVFAPIP